MSTCVCSEARWAEIEPITPSLLGFSSESPEWPPSPFPSSLSTAVCNAGAYTHIGFIDEPIEFLESELKVLLLPKDPNDEKNVILEVRAGTGGDEAALFGADLLRMYTRYAERQGWKTEIMDVNDTEMGDNSINSESVGTGGGSFY